MPKYKVILMDMDGVIWRGTEYIEENIVAIKELSKQYIIIYMTNNSSKSRSEYVERLRRAGLDATMDNVYTSGYLTAQYIVEKGIGKTFVVGEAGLYHELITHNIPLVADAPRVDYVVVGLDRYVTYGKLRRALHYILDGSIFISTNNDPVYPVGGKLDPGAGAIISFLSTASGRKPDFIAGKPNKWIVELVRRRFNVGAEGILIVGDSLFTDIPLGFEAGCDTLLLLTGITTTEQVKKSSIKPTYIYRTLKDALEMLI